MTVFFIGCTFIAFVVILIIILIYLQQTSTSSNKFNKRVVKSKRKIQPIFTKLVNNKNIKENYVDEIKNILTNRAEITAFNELYLEYVEKNGKTDKLKELIKEIICDDVIFNKNIYKGKYKIDYALYLYYFYEIVADSSINYAFDNLDSDSLYTRINAMKVIENSDNIDNYVKVLEIINKSSHYISEKNIIDFLISFKGNRTAFNELLVNSFDNYEIEIQKDIINYFIIRKYDSELIRKLILKIFLNNKDNELIISGIKYFGFIIDEKASKYISKYLDSDVTEIRLLASKIAYKYPSDIVKHKLKRNLTDMNWYVRNNAAYSLVRLEYTNEEKKEILNSKDKYAVEAFKQALENKKVI